jgi:two-component system sensor histidine kinase AtoS
MSMLSYLKNLTKSRHSGIEISTLDSLLNMFNQAAIIVNPSNLNILCANIKASELTAYSRTDLINLPLDKLLLPPENTPLSSYFHGIGLTDLQTELGCELLHHNGTGIPALITTSRLAGNEGLVVVILSTQEDVLQQSLATQRQQNLWSELNHLLVAYTQSDLSVALQQALSNAMALSGATALGIYLADGHMPNLRQAASLDPASLLPEDIPPQDLGTLNYAHLWLNGKRPLAALHRQARSVNLSYVASAPIGEINTIIGILTAAGSGDPPESILEIVEYLANQIYFHIQSNMLITQLQNDLQTFQQQQLAGDTVFDGIDDGLIFLTPERQIVKLNAAAELALGYTNAEVQELSIINVLICNENLETTFRFVEEELQPSSLSSLRLYRRNGDSFLANLRVLPIIANDQLHRILVLFQDQSEQEEYKTRNQQLEQRATLADITASFAHEVRNPINNISTGLQLLALHLPKADPNQENISRLQNDCERLADLVKSGLSFVRPVEYKLEPVDLGKLITNLMDRWRNRLARTQVKFNPQIDADIPPAEGDLRALEQVFTNLIDNAIQAMEATGGTLTINVRHISELDERSHIEVNILDNGPGIPPEAREHIFEPFYTTKRSGTGLGLAIVKRIVTAHKGSIHVNSIPGGTMFRVRIPCS